MGSGNLTPGGLRGNYEAFTIDKLSKTAQASLNRQWVAWQEFHTKELLPLANAKVRARAGRNTGKEPRGSTQRRDLIVEDKEGNLSIGPGWVPSDAVLIAEIPKGGGRWNQANFDLKTFQEFFGAKPGRTQRIVLTHVSKAGRPARQELRPSVSVKSHNYRFELEAGAGKTYPRRGRPIGVFLRVAVRTFRYRLMMPGSSEHTAVQRFLRAKCPSSATRVRRLRTTAGKLEGKSFFRPLARVRIG